MNKPLKCIVALMLCGVFFLFTPLRVAGAAAAEGSINRQGWILCDEASNKRRHEVRALVQPYTQRFSIAPVAQQPFNLESLKRDIVQNFGRDLQSVEYENALLAMRQLLDSEIDLVMYSAYQVAQQNISLAIVERYMNVPASPIHICFYAPNIFYLINKAGDDRELPQAIFNTLSRVLERPEDLQRMEQFVIARCADLLSSKQLPRNWRDEKVFILWRFCHHLLNSANERAFKVLFLNDSPEDYNYLQALLHLRPGQHYVGISKNFLESLFVFTPVMAILPLGEEVQRFKAIIRPRCATEADRAECFAWYNYYFQIFLVDWYQKNYAQLQQFSQKLKNATIQDLKRLAPEKRAQLSRFSKEPNPLGGLFRDSMKEMGINISLQSIRDDMPPLSVEAAFEERWHAWELECDAAWKNVIAHAKKLSKQHKVAEEIARALEPEELVGEAPEVETAEEQVDTGAGAAGAAQEAMAPAADSEPLVPLKGQKTRKQKESDQKVPSAEGLVATSLEINDGAATIITTYKKNLAGVALSRGIDVVSDRQYTCEVKLFKDPFSAKAPDTVVIGERFAYDRRTKKWFSDPSAELRERGYYKGIPGLPHITTGFEADKVILIHTIPIELDRYATLGSYSAYQGSSENPSFTLPGFFSYTNSQGTITLDGAFTWTFRKATSSERTPTGWVCYHRTFQGREVRSSRT